LREEEEARGGKKGGEGGREGEQEAKTLEYQNPGNPPATGSYFTAEAVLRLLTFLQHDIHLHYLRCIFSHEGTIINSIYLFIFALLIKSGHKDSKQII
jgi:hypothetical protein